MIENLEILSKIQYDKQRGMDREKNEEEERKKLACAKSSLLNRRVRLNFKTHLFNKVKSSPKFVFVMSKDKNVNIPLKAYLLLLKHR